MGTGLDFGSDGREWDRNPVPCRALLLAHSHSPCKDIWMKGSTSKKPNFNSIMVSNIQ